MNLFWQTPVVVLAVLDWLAAPPKSIGEAAQREALRRQATPKSRAFLTNFGQPPAGTPPSVVTLPPDPGEPPVTEPPVVAPPPVEAPKQDETWWRERIVKARETLASDEAMAAALETRINGLRRDVVKFDDPARRAKLRQDLQQAVGDQAQLQKKLDEDRAAIAAIQEDARRQGIPPGWIR